MGRVRVRCNTHEPIRYVGAPCSIHDEGRPELIAIWCRWRGYRIGPEDRAKNDPCPKCGAEVSVLRR
jgi:hypothetical protein